MTTRSVHKQFFPIYVLGSLLIVLIMGSFAVGVWRDAVREQISLDLETDAGLIAQRLSPILVNGDTTAVNSLIHELRKTADCRITVTGPFGQLWGETVDTLFVMEEYFERPEFAAALAGGTGTATRYSNTAQREFMYYAQAVVHDGRTLAVVRTGRPLATLGEALKPITKELSLLALCVVLLAALISWLMARSISLPLRSLTAAAEAMAAGRPAPLVMHSGISEIAELAHAQQRLGAELAEHITTIGRQEGVQSAILASMSEGILAFDAEERVVGCNAAAERILDVNAERVRGRSLPEVVRNTRLQMLVRDTLASQQPGQATLTITGAEERTALATVRMLHDVDGSYRGVLVVLNDITKQSRLERMRRDFVANVSHELKTPITSIVGSIETLLDGAADDPDDRDKFLEIIKKQSVRLNNLVEDLLNLSHIERLAERGEVDVTPVRLQQVVQSAVSACETVAAQRATRVTVSCPADLVVQANPRLLEQAVINLVDNAIKYGEPGNVVEVNVTTAGDTVFLQVHDQGPGIAPEHLPRIFERFYRAENSRSREFGGTGLGLAIVKHVALAHGGRVAVESKRGQGSTFTITIPL